MNLNGTRSRGAIFRYRLRIRSRHSGRWVTADPVERSCGSMPEAIEAKESLIARLGVAAPSAAELELPLQRPPAAYVISASCEPAS